MAKEEMDLKDFCEIIKKIEIGSGKPSKINGSQKLQWRETSGKIEGGSLYFHSSEEISDRKLSREELKAKEKQVRKLLLSDLVASGAYSSEQLKSRESSVIDLVVKAHEEIFRLNHDTKMGIKEGRAAVISGSIKFYAAPNIGAMIKV